MPNPKKKPRLVGPAAGSSTVATRRSRRLAGRPSGTIALANAVVEHIFGYLPPEDIMRSRRVCKRWKDAAKKTIVPMPHNRFIVNSSMQYSAMMAISTAMPNLAQICLCNLGYDIIYSHGEEPDETQAANAASLFTVAAFPETMSRFRMLRALDFSRVPLNGRYPFLFDFPLLESLLIHDCKYFKWDLEMLRGLPILKNLYVMSNGEFITGNIKSFRALKNTLEHVTIQIEEEHVSNIVGNLMDLADFPHLKHLHLSDTVVTGDIRDIDEQDFSALNYLFLPKTVYGGSCYEFRRISEVSECVNVIDRIRRKRDKSMFTPGYTWILANDSPDRYYMDHLDAISHPPPPFTIQLVRMGSRFGWCWKNDYDERCEVNWLDPEPERDSSDYEEYTNALRRLEYGIYFFKGYHQPPSEADYRLLCEDRSRFRVIH